MAQAIYTPQLILTKQIEFGAHVLGVKVGDVVSLVGVDVWNLEFEHEEAAEREPDRFDEVLQVFVVSPRRLEEFSIFGRREVGEYPRCSIIQIPFLPLVPRSECDVGEGQ